MAKWVKKMPIRSGYYWVRRNPHRQRRGCERTFPEFVIFELDDWGGWRGLDEMYYEDLEDFCLSYPEFWDEPLVAPLYPKTRS